ncbi:helix-turn-helix domain-containing protein [Wukongibacter baidiensis]|uniref:ArsR/SmtB family transcription factor n=1 Tax=Wukongibacter baidiensis TaxID=1723361 RepID=UPI003D7F5EB0
MKKIKTLTSLEEIKVFSDPYRLQILRCFDLLGEPATVKQIADEMGEVPAKVHYHVKKMEKIGILELMYTKDINGIIAKYYSPTAESFTVKNSNLESPMFKSFLDKTQGLISNVFDDGKRIFLEQLDSDNVYKSKESEDGFLTSSYVYLTQNQYRDLQKYIRELSEANTKKDSEGKEKYFLLSSMIKIKDSE